MSEPYDPKCGQYASQMEHLDVYKADDQSRADYVRQEEGTYNPSNEHFLCDPCYIDAGMPTSPGGWKCP